jgi:hypothetical protein
VRAKPGATTLVSAADAAASSGDGLPLLAFQHMGAGRVLFSGTDETYRWRSLHPEAYARFWVKAIRYLFEGRLTAGDSRLRLRVEPEVVELGGAVVVTAERRDLDREASATPDVQLELRAPGEPPRPLELVPAAARAAELEVTLRPPRTGSYTVAATGDASGSAAVSFEVVPAALEREGPVDLAELRAIASAPGGVLCTTPQDLLDQLDRIPSRRATDVLRSPHPLWDGWLTVAALVAVAALEWWLRKWWNLL